MERTLYNNIKQFAYSNPVRMHMPGHKGRNEKEYYRMDVTELSFDDNLISPKNVIQDINDELKDLFKTVKSYILVNGSTGGIISAFLCSLSKGEKVILPRNSHLSAYYGLYLSGAEPVFYYPKNKVKGLSGEEYIESVYENPEAKAIFITYPTYYGCCIDIVEVCKRIKEINENIIIIVDEAHGTHMYFSEQYPDSSLNADSDIVITSMHKTLTGLTQTSMLHVNSKKINIDAMDIYYKMTTSTSPSFLLVTSVEEAIKYAKENAKEKLGVLKNVYLYAKEEIEESTSFYFEEFGSEKHDYLKICLNTSKSLLDGYTLSEILEKDFNIFVEASTSEFCLFYLGLNSNESDVKKVVEALKVIESKNYSCKKKVAMEFDNYETVKGCSMCTAIKGCGEKIRLEESEGRILQNFIVPYPPGFPVLVPGEKMNKEILSFVMEIEDKQSVLGLDNGYVNVLRKENI